MAFAQFILCENKTAEDSCGQCPSCRKINELQHPDLHFSFPTVQSVSKTSKPFYEDWTIEEATLVMWEQVSTAVGWANTAVNYVNTDPVNGEILSTSDVRIIRDGKIVHTGKISSIFREKNQVKQVASGQECGITVKDYIDFQKNDTIEAFTVETTERSI